MKKNKILWLVIVLWVAVVLFFVNGCKDNGHDIEKLREEVIKVRMMNAVSLHNDTVMFKAMRRSDSIIAEQKSIFDYQFGKMNENHKRDKDEKSKIKAVPVDKLQAFTDSVNKLDRANGR